MFIKYLVYSLIQQLFAECLLEPAQREIQHGQGTQGLVKDTHSLGQLPNTAQCSRPGVNRVNGVQARERLALIGKGEMEEGFKHRLEPPLKDPCRSPGREGGDEKGPQVESIV